MKEEKTGYIDISGLAQADHKRKGNLWVFQSFLDF